MEPTSNFFHFLNTNVHLHHWVFVLIGIFSIFWFVRIFTKPKRPLPPGPLGLPLVGNLPFLDPELHLYFRNLAQKYGPIFKLWLGSKLTVVVSSSTVAQEILKDQDTTFANHDVPTVARTLTYGGVDIAWNPYGPEWRMLRKICVIKLLSKSNIDSIYTLRRQEVRKTIGYLHKQAQEGSHVNIGEQMFLMTLNLMMNMLWGGTIKDNAKMSVGLEFRQVVSEITRLLGKPNVSDFFPSLARFDLQGLEKRMRGLAQKLDEMFNQAIDQHLRTGGSGFEECKDFLQHLLKLKDEGDARSPLTMEHVKAVLMDLVVAGTDTSSNTIEFAMAELINKPKILRKAQQELDEIVGKDNVVEESHITKLPYLLAIMKETLRLHALIPLLIPHKPSQTTVVAGYTIPKDSRVFINAWAIHRDPKIWKNPSEFKPERFLDNTCDFSGGDFCYLPFGSGRRICAGIAMAERIVLYCLATLLHSFDWKVPEGERSEVEEKFGIVLALKNPLVVVPIPRLCKPNLYL